MSNGTARYFIIALIALLLADWTQPLLLQACTPASATAGGRAACGMASEDMASGGMLPSCCAVAPLGHDGADRADAGAHNAPQPGQAANTGGAACSMQVCPSFVPPILAANPPFVALPVLSEYVVVPHDTPLPSSPVSGLFRPPRTSITIRG